MSMWTFLYNLEHKEWQENKSSFASVAILNTPIIPIVTCNFERTGEEWTKAWCKKHRDYEEIEKFDKNGIMTKNGCHLKGIAVPMWNYVYQTSYSYQDRTSTASVRFQIRSEKGLVYLEHNTVNYFFAWEKNKTTGDFVAVPIFDFCANSYTFSIASKEHPKFPCNLPYPVVGRLLVALGEEVSLKLAYKPKILPFPTDKVGCDTLNDDFRSELWLKAFLNRPLDMNIYFFYKYFKDSKEFDFDTLFPRDNKDNFETLAQVLKLEPTLTLKNLYETNPLAIILRMMLPELGIKKEELLQKFDRLQSFCGKNMKESYGNKLFFDPLKRKKEEPLDDEARDFENLKFFLNWLGQYISEEELAERLLGVQKHWRNSLYTGFSYFKKYFNIVPEEWKKEILQYGFNINMRDKLAVLADEQIEKENSFECNEEARFWECKINGYNFRLIPSLKEFLQIERNLCFFIITKAEEMEGNDNAFFAVERNGRNLGGIWMQGKVAKKYYFIESWNKLLYAKCGIVFHHWLRIHGLELAYYSSNNDIFQAESQEFFVEPVDKDEEYEKMSLLEMSMLPSDAIRQGYYINYYRKLVTENW